MKDQELIDASVVWLLPLPAEADGDACPGSDEHALATVCDHLGLPQQFAPKREGWFSRSRVGRAVTENVCVSGHAAPAFGLDGWTVWDELGVKLVSLELHSSEINVAVLHFTLDSVGLGHVEDFVDLLRRPRYAATFLKRHGDINRPAREAQGSWRKLITEILQVHGASAALNDGGYVWSDDNSVRPTVITYVESEGQLPVPRCYPAGVSETAAWTHRLANGARADKFEFYPADPAIIDAEVRAWGTARVAAGQNGLAIVQPDRADVDEWKIQQMRLLVHSRFVDLVLLAMRQRSFLDRHANALAETGAEWRGDSLGEHEFARVLEHEWSLMNFRNQLWFSVVPWRDTGTDVLELLHARWRLPALFDEVASEQADLERLLALYAEKERRQAAEDKRARDKAEAERRDSARSRLEYFLAWATPVTVISTVAALVADPSVALVVCALAASALLTVIAIRLLGERRSER